MVLIVDGADRAAGLDSATGTAGKNRASPAIFGGSQKKMANVKGRSLAFFFNGVIVVDGADRAARVDGATVTAGRN